MAEAIAAAVVKGFALTGTAATVVAAAVQVGVYATAAAIASQNGERSEQGGLIDLQLNSAAPRQMVIGKRMTGGVLIDWYLAGTNNTKLYLPVYLSEGPCGQVTRVFADGREVWSTPLVHGTRTTIPDFRSGGDRLWLTYYDGRVGQTADATLVALGQGWTSANKMTGCAWVLIECQWDSDNMRSPPSLSFEMEGAKLYDRRKDTTAGGSGAHRLSDASTWEFSDNPAVALDHYLLGRYWSGARTFGIGLSADEVPYSYFAAQANVCDEDVDLKAGGTQKRYRANGFILASEDYSTVITKLCTAMAARAADFGGRFGVIGVESKTPVLTIDDGDLIAGVQEVYTPKRSWAELVGEVEGRFQDPAQLYQPTPYPNVTDATWEAEDGGEPKLFTLDLEFETDVERAQRLALLKARQERRQATLRGVYPLWTVELERGDWFVRTGTKWGEDGKTFEVIERVLDPATYTVTIVSQEVDATDSAWDENVASDGPPAPIDPTDTLSAVQIPSLTVTPVTIAGLAATIPSLKVAWGSVTDPRVNAIFVEVFRTGDDQKVATAYQAIPDDDNEVIVQNGVADDVAYYVRAKFLTPSLSSAWSTEISTTSDDAYALGSASTVPWSGVTDDNGMRPDNNADVTSANTAAAITGQGWGATASEASASNALVPAGQNGLVDTEFRFQSTYWSKDSPTGSTTFGVITSPRGLRVGTLTGAGLSGAGTDYVRYWSNAQGSQFLCKPGDVVGARAQLGGDNLTSVRLYIAFRNAAGTLLSITSGTIVSSGILDGLGEETTFNELTNYGTAPAGTVYATIDMRGYSTNAAPVLRVAKPLMARLAAGQTAVPAYMPGREHELGANVTESRTAAAIISQGAFATLSSAAYGSGLLTGFGSLAALAFAQLGSNIRLENGLTVATNALLQTSLGTAAAITSQGALATLSTINSSGLVGAGVITYTALASTAVRLGTNITRNDGTTSLTDALAVTSLGTAAAITSQGSLATLSALNASSQIGVGLVLASKLGIGDTSNLIQDPDFLDTAYWTLSAGGAPSGAWTFASTDSEATTDLGVKRALKTPAGAGTTTQYFYTASNVAANYIPVEPGRAYQVTARVRVKSGFTQQAYLQVNWYKQDGTAASTASSSISGADYRTVAAVADTTSTLEGLLTAPADAHYARFNFVARTSTTLSNAGHAYFGPPRMRRAYALGTMMVREDGVTALTDASAVTALGTASAITSQGAFATLNTVNSSALIGAGVVIHTALASTAVRLGTNITRADGSTSLTDALAVTSLGTAAAITSQGALATLGQVNLGASGKVYRDDGSTRLTDALAVTALGTAAAITGQGALATKATIDSSGLVGSGVIIFSALASTAVRLGTNITRADGSTALTDALAVTSLGTAAAITGQGGLATKSAVDLATSEVTNKSLTAVDLAAATKLGTIETNADVTADNTASAITGQGPWATTATTVAAVTDAFGFGANDCADSEFRNLTGVWNSRYLQSGTETVFAAYDDSGARNVYRTLTGMTIGHQANISQSETTALLVSPGDRVEGSAILIANTGVSTLQISLDWRDAAGTYLSSSTSAALTTGVRGGVFAVAPASAASVVITAVAISSASTMRFDMSQPMLRRCSATQTALSPYSPSGDRASEAKLGGVETGANVTETRTAAAITGQGGFATLSFATLGTNVRLADGTTLATNALLVTSLGTASAITGQGSLATTNFVLFSSTVRLADGTTIVTDAMVVTASGTAGGIAGQGNQATANAARGNTASRPATTGGWGWYSNTETGTLQLDVDGTGWVDVASLSAPLTVSRTNGFVKTKIGAGTNTTDSVTFTGSGGSGAGYTFAHELIVTYTTGPTPTVSSASGSPITVSATGGVAGDEARGFVVTIVTDSLGAKAQLISPVALFWES